MPGLVVHDHFDQNVTREQFSFDFLIALVAFFNNLFDRDVYREYQLFEPAVFHDLFDVRGNLVFIARVGMNHIPKRCALLG